MAIKKDVCCYKAIQGLNNILNQTENHKYCRNVSLRLVVEA